MSQNSQYRDILRTRPGRVRDVSGTCPDGDTFLGNFGQGHGTSLRNKNNDIGQIDSGHFGDVPKWSGQGHFEDTSGTCPNISFYSWYKSNRKRKK